MERRVAETAEGITEMQLDRASTYITADGTVAVVAKAATPLDKGNLLVDLAPSDDSGARGSPAFATLGTAVATKEAAENEPARRQRSLTASSHRSV
jgi:hypothetical protein